MDKPNYYTNLPAEVRYDNSLPFGARVLYSEIATLAAKEGKCWATNDFFATLFNTTTRNISRWISCLSQNGYIIINYTTSIESKKIGQRCIFLSTPLDKNVHPPTTKMSKGYRQKCPTPLDKNV